MIHISKKSYGTSVLTLYFKKSFMWQNKVRRLCDLRLALSMCTPTELTRSFKTQQFQKSRAMILSFQSQTDYFCVPRESRSVFKHLNEMCRLYLPKNTCSFGSHLLERVNNSKLNWSMGDTKQTAAYWCKNKRRGNCMFPDRQLHDAWRATQTNRLCLRLKWSCFF